MVAPSEPITETDGRCGPWLRRPALTETDGRFGLRLRRPAQAAGSAPGCGAAAGAGGRFGLWLRRPAQAMIAADDRFSCFTT